MGLSRRDFIAASVVGLAATNACDKPQQQPPTRTAPGLDNASEREISYLLLREDSGKAVRVPETFQFQSGEKFRLRFRPGFPAYIYVANRGKGENSYSVLFPLPAERSRNPLPAGTAVGVPNDTEWLRFDKVPGNEYFVLIASSVALPDLEKAGAQIGLDTFEAQLANIERQYQPTSSRRFQDGDWTKFFAAREGDIAIVVRLPLQHG
jgi:hypothetical protein